MRDVRGTDDEGGPEGGSRALVVAQATPVSRPAARPGAAFLTQLLAARARGRSSWRQRGGDPQQAAARYEARALARLRDTVLLDRSS